MVVSSRFLAVDWGTTNRRVFTIEDGVVLDTVRDDHGATAVAAADYPAEVAAIRAAQGDLPMLMAGMVGSTVGWRNVPYVPVPAGMPALVAGLDWIDDRTAIVPGLSITTATRADVMRGEEVQLLGAVAAGFAPADALLCQPGTHNKWATMRGGEIAAFTTAMTGEIFGLLRKHGLLAKQLGGEVHDGAAFREGVQEAASRDLLASLFGIRARGVLGLRDDADAASFASGLIIGSDVAARLAEAPGATIYILADAGLGGLYAAAIAALGGRSVAVDSHAAFVAGITRLWKLTS